MANAPVNILYLLQSIFRIIWQDEDDFAIRILCKNPLFFPSLEKKKAGKGALIQVPG